MEPGWGDAEIACPDAAGIEEPPTAEGEGGRWAGRAGTLPCRNPTYGVACAPFPSGTASGADLLTAGGCGIANI